MYLQYGWIASANALVDCDRSSDMLHSGQFVGSSLGITRKNTFSCKTLNDIELVSLSIPILLSLMLVLCG